MSPHFSSREGGFQHFSVPKNEAGSKRTEEEGPVALHGKAEGAGGEEVRKCLQTQKEDYDLQ